MNVVTAPSGGFVRVDGKPVQLAEGDVVPDGVDQGDLERLQRFGVIGDGPATAPEGDGNPPPPDPPGSGSGDPAGDNSSTLKGRRKS